MIKLNLKIHLLQGVIYSMIVVSSPSDLFGQDSTLSEQSPSHPTLHKHKVENLSSFELFIPVIEKWNKEVKEAAPLNPDTTLIIIDVDSTLTTLQSPILRRQAIQRYRPFYDTVTKTLTAEQKQIFEHLVVVDGSSILVENCIPSIVKLLQEKAKIVACTAAKTGPIGDYLACFPSWRYQELERLGIDFSSHFPHEILFSQLEDYNNSTPGLMKGILYCGHKLKKGDVLEPFLNKVNWKPQRIIVIDDKIENITSLAEAASRILPSAHVLGIHYLGMNNYESPFIEEEVFKAKILSLIKKTKEICPSS